MTDYNYFCKRCSTETHLGLCPICNKQAYSEALGDKGRILECPCGWKFAGLNASEEHAQHMDQCFATQQGRRNLARREIGLFWRFFLTPKRLKEMEDVGIKAFERKWAEQKELDRIYPSRR